MCKVVSLAARLVTMMIIIYQGTVGQSVSRVTQEDPVSSLKPSKQCLILGEVVVYVPVPATVGSDSQPLEAVVADERWSSGWQWMETTTRQGKTGQDKTREVTNNDKIDATRLSQSISLHVWKGVVPTAVFLCERLSSEKASCSSCCPPNQERPSRPPTHVALL